MGHEIIILPEASQNLLSDFFPIYGAPNAEFVTFSSLFFSGTPTQLIHIIFRGDPNPDVFH